jgi:Ca-activated chloride channel family protein
MDMENRLGLVKRSLQLLVDRLRPDDSVSIVVFGTTARVVLHPTSGANKDAILSAIYSLEPEGSTNTEAGLTLGYDMAARSYLPGGINRVILCSDGVGNVGTTDPIQLINQVKGSAPDGVMLTTIGFGMDNFNDVMLEQLANKGNGFYAYVDTLEEARKMFIDRLTNTLQAIAKDAKVQVDFNADVVARYRLIGYENRAVADQDFRDDRVDAGELGAGHNATAIYAIQLRPGAQGKIGTVQLRWQEPSTREVKELASDFNTWDLAQSFNQTSPRFQMNAVVAQYAEILRKSPYAETTLNQLSEYAWQVARSLPNDADVQEFAQLVQRASRLR